MVQARAEKNALHELGYKIFLDRYAQKDMKRTTLVVGDTVIVVVDSQTGQREIGSITSMDLPRVTVQLLDGTVVERDVENVDKPLETDPAQMMDRVASGVAAVEATPELRRQWAQRFRWALDDWKFVPAGRILAAAGTDQELTYYNCYVIPSPHDSRGGIIETLRQMTEIMSRGGGVGINVSSLRPRSAYVKGVNGRSSGAVSWGALYSFVTGLIEQGGCFGPNERILTDKGLIPAGELADRMDAGEVFYAHTHKGLRQITYRFRNGVKPLYEVTTKRGYKVRITEAHKVAVLMDGKITTMPLKYLQQGDEILLLLEQDVMEAVGSPARTDSYGTSPDTIASIVPVGESDVYDFEVDEVHLVSANNIYTSNSRRGALMLILNDTHPDIFDFINSKRKAGQITNANISVGVSDRLMDAVKADADWDLVFPDTSEPDYDDVWDGDLEKWEASGRRVLHYRTVRARDLWNAIIESAWASAEPGVWFRDRYNKMSNSAYYPEGNIICTNPCVTGDTLIYTGDGLVRADELFDDERSVEAVIDGRFGFDQTTVTASRVFLTGQKMVYRLQTKEGYFLRATGDHRVMTPRGWVEIQDLKPGDKVHILNRKGGFGAEGSLELGRVLGWLVGDGTFNGREAVLSFFGAEKQTLAPMFAQHVNTLVAPLTANNRVYQIAPTLIADRDEARVSSARLMTVAEQYGLMETKHRVPEAVFKGSEDMQRGFLQALFTADGGFQDGDVKGGSIRLASSHIELLEGTQLLLGNFGIASRIYRNRRKAQYRDMPDGKGGLKAYWCEAQHELVISKINMVTFADEIGFMVDYKQQALEDYVTRGKRGPYSESFTATVEGVTEEGIEDVFDLTEPLTHSFVSNCIVLHNCGEQGLPANGVCNLGAINLAAFYDGETHDVKWDDLDETSRIATRFLDNVIDTTPYFFEANKMQQLNERRVGLNTMGIAELMVKLGIRYGSDESVAFIDKLYSFIVRAIYETSIELAQEKGPFPKCDPEKFIQSGFMQTMPEDIREKVRQHGIRNVTLTTQAPNGTIGTMVNTSTGIEPFFSWTYYRKSRLGLHEEKVPIVQEWLDEHPGETDLPDYFVTAMDLSPEEHIKVQAAIQRWVDSSISKTANVPNDYTVEQVSDLYWYMYDLGCKGGTIYRDGSRNEQVLMLKEDEHAEKEIAQKTDNGHVAEPPVTQVSTPHHVYPRPNKLAGVTVRRKTPFGNAFITMNTDDGGNPFEVFITVGKAGSDLQADADGLARMISLALRSTAPQNRLRMLELIIDQLQNLGGARTVGLGPSRVSSLPDAVAGALQEHYFRQEAVTQLGLPMNGDTHSHTSHAEPVSQDGSVKGADMCPECGTYSLIRAEGCRTCLNCGYSEC
jgi:ribonucleoside-diphosphate reductase alpha chain